MPVPFSMGLWTREVCEVQAVTKKMFDVSRPHVHRCDTCRADIHCRAEGCEYPERTACANCREGVEYEWRGRDIVAFRRVPARYPNV